MHQAGLSSFFHKVQLTLFIPTFPDAVKDKAALGFSDQSLNTKQAGHTYKCNRWIYAFVYLQEYGWT